MDNKKITKSFTLPQDLIELIEKENAARRLDNDSAALRQILYEWEKYKAVSNNSDKSNSAPAPTAGD